jgi:outer membrane protein OmpA-like peptidoglycan-associated protein
VLRPARPTFPPPKALVGSLTVTADVTAGGSSMAQTRNQRADAGGPAGWVILLGLMVLALVIAAASKGCGDDDSAVVDGSSTPTASTGTGQAPAGGNPQAQSVIDQIQNEITNAGGIQFTTGKAELTAASRSTLDRIATLLARNPTVKAEIGGHTDTQGDEQKNLVLSEDRAKAVLQYLTGKGIKAGQLTAKGYGETQPVVQPDTTEEARTKNRRVEFKLIS